MKAKSLIALCLAVLLAANSQSSDRRASAEIDAIEVMVLGTWHLAGSSSNIVDVDGPDVLTSKRQVELQQLAERLVQFKPTVVAVERETAAPDFIDKDFYNFESAMLRDNANEVVQIGYRIAAMIGLEQVYGIDEKTREDDPVYFPFAALLEHVRSEGRESEIDRLISNDRERAMARMERYSSMDLGNALADLNSQSDEAAAVYFRLNSFDTGEDQPGAELQGYWYMRNAKIFSKLRQVAEPGDRVIVIYGSGHKFWLDHFVSNTPGFRSVDPAPYLLAD